MDIAPFKTWEYEDQTKMKHQIFEDYIDKWIKIVGAYNKLNYIDGFAGIGAYTDKSGKIYFGSPVLVAEAVEKLSSRLQRSVRILVVDKNKENLENISKIFKSKQLTIKPTLVNDDFDNFINKVLDNVQNIAPTFVFIDPFGFKIDCKTIEKIMKIDKSEILFNFMYNSVNEFLGAPKLDVIYDQLFGCQNWRECTKLEKNNREKCIIECMRKQLKNFARYVYYYRLEFPDKKRTYYYLFHLTNHYLGCSIMKSSFAKYNFGRVEYRGVRGVQLAFFENDEVVVDKAITYLKNFYKGKQKSFEDIVKELIDETEFLESHLREAIKKMEGKDVELSRIPPKTKAGGKRIGIDRHDIIVFK